MIVNLPSSPRQPALLALCLSPLSSIASIYRPEGSEIVSRSGQHLSPSWKNRADKEKRERNSGLQSIIVRSRPDVGRTGRGGINAVTSTTPAGYARFRRAGKFPFPSRDDERQTRGSSCLPPGAVSLNDVLNETKLAETRDAKEGKRGAHLRGIARLITAE